MSFIDRFRRKPHPETKPPFAIDRNSLLTPEGLEEFNRRMIQSQGRALIVVHPFYIDAALAGAVRNGLQPPERLTEYPIYQNLLKDEVTQYSQDGIPVILFEEARLLLEPKVFNSDIDRLGFTGDSIFTVPTTDLDESPEPETGTLKDLTAKLKAAGLLHARVVGMAFDFDDHHSKEDSILKGSAHGCAGLVAKKLYQQGEVSVTVGTTFTST